MAGREAGSRDERGAVTAELALGLPVLLAVTAALVWLLAVGAAQVMVVDSAREAARMLARGDYPERAVQVASRIAPDGARVTVRSDDTEVWVVTSARVEAPGRLLGGWAGVTVRAEAVAVAETP